MKNSLMIRIITLLFLFILSFTVRAADDFGLDGGSMQTDIVGSMNKITEVIDKFSQDYRESAGVQNASQTLLGGLSIIALALAGFKLALTSGSLSEPMSRMITTIFTIGFAMFLSSKEGFDMFFPNGIDNLINHLVNLAGGTDKIGLMLQKFMENEFEVIGKVIEQFKAYSLWDWITKSGFTIIVMIGLFIALLVATLVGMIATLTALVVLAISFAVGPIFIPFLVLEKTSFLFDGWLKFTINACLTKLIIALLLAIGAAAMSAVVTHAGAGGSILSLMLAAFAVSGVIAALMSSAGGMAGALTSGGSIGTDGFAGRMHSAARAMGRNSSVQGSQGLGTKSVNLGDKIGGRTGDAMKALGNRLRSSSTSGNTGGLKASDPSGEARAARAADIKNETKASNARMVNQSMDAARKAGLE